MIHFHMLHTADCIAAENTICMCHSNDTAMVDLSNSIQQYMPDVETFPKWRKIILLTSRLQNKRITY